MIPRTRDPLGPPQPAPHAPEAAAPAVPADTEAMLAALADCAVLPDMAARMHDDHLVATAFRAARAAAARETADELYAAVRGTLASTPAVWQALPLPVARPVRTPAGAPAWVRRRRHLGWLARHWPGTHRTPSRLVGVVPVRPDHGGRWLAHAVLMTPDGCLWCAPGVARLAARPRTGQFLPAGPTPDAPPAIVMMGWLPAPHRRRRPDASRPALRALPADAPYRGAVIATVGRAVRTARTALDATAGRLRAELDAVGL